MAYIIGFIVGVVATSVVWFLVWRNNKKKFVEALEGINDSDVVNKIKKLLGK